MNSIYPSGIVTHVGYVETNSSWYKDERSACRLLERLKSKGLNTLLISISPFHLESIPFSKVENVMAACSKTGIQIFPWMDTFLSDIENFDKSRCHRFEEMKTKTPAQAIFWIHHIFILICMEIIFPVSVQAFPWK